MVITTAKYVSASTIYQYIKKQVHFFCQYVPSNNIEININTCMSMIMLKNVVPVVYLNDIFIKPVLHDLLSHLFIEISFKLYAS